MIACEAMTVLTGGRMSVNLKFKTKKLSTGSCYLSLPAAAATTAAKRTAAEAAPAASATEASTSKRAS